jgi:methyl-accepting chemotaxis protein
MIEDVGSIAVVISTAVGQQDVATAEIARNVQKAAVDTCEVTETIAGVNDAAEDTGCAAEQMLEAAESLAAQARSLNTEMRAFVAGVQAA